MPILKVKNLEAENIGEIDLSDDVFGLEVNNNLVHQVFVVQAANLRSPIAHTKTRGERSGSGRKPWKQKGTGRARVGSVRTPVWRGGGIVFGPTKERNFKRAVNKKMKRLAIRMAIASKVQSGEVIVLENYFFPNNKTKEAANFIKKAHLEGSLLWVFQKNEKEYMRACQNLKKSKLELVNNLNVLEVLNNRYLIFSKEGIGFLNNFFSEENQEKASSRVKND